MTSDQLQRRVQLPYHSVWRKKVFWTWLEEMFISSDMRGDISLLNIYCGAAMIEVRTRKMPFNALVFTLRYKVELDWTRAIRHVIAQSVQFSKIAKKLT